MPVEHGSVTLSAAATATAASAALPPDFRISEDEEDKDQIMLYYNTAQFWTMFSKMKKFNNKVREN